MALEMKSEENPIVDANLFVAHPGFSTINETIFGHLDPETLANCRLVSKAWKHFIDTSKKVLLVQVDHLMNYDMKRPETFDRKDETYEVTSIIERWPTYQRVLKFLKTKATLNEIKLVLRFLKEYCRTNTFDVKGFLFSLTATPLVKAGALGVILGKHSLRIFEGSNKIVQGIIVASLYEEKCVCDQRFTDEEELDYMLWVNLKIREPNARKIEVGPYCIIHEKRQ